MPMPKIRRPLDKTSTEASSFANTTGLRWGRIMIPVPRRTLLVGAATKASATAEFLRESGGGVLTPAGEPAALLAAVERVATSPSLKERLVRSGRSFADQHLTRSRALRGFDEWIEEIVARFPLIQDRGYEQSRRRLERAADPDSLGGDQITDAS